MTGSGAWCFSFPGGTPRIDRTFDQRPHGQVTTDTCQNTALVQAPCSFRNMLNFACASCSKKQNIESSNHGRTSMPRNKNLSDF